MKGIILAGGTGSRLHPLTAAFSKQLLPVYDKPMVYYPLSTLMLGGVREFLVITTPTDAPMFRKVLGNGSEVGLDITYAQQLQPAGIADALRIGAEFIGTGPVALILGDNIFSGADLPDLLARSLADVDGCTLFGLTVPDPRPYGVAEKDASGRLIGLEEKPARPRSSEIVTGLYVYSGDVVDVVRGITPSARGELEITDVNRAYLAQGRARIHSLDSGTRWLDAGTYDGLFDAAAFVRAEEQRGVRLGCLEEIALRLGYIDADACYALGSKHRKSGYGRYVMAISGKAD